MNREQADRERTEAIEKNLATAEIEEIDRVRELELELKLAEIEKEAETIFSPGVEVHYGKLFAVWLCAAVLLTPLLLYLKVSLIGILLISLIAPGVAFVLQLKKGR